MSKFKTNEEYFEFSKRLVVIPTEEIKDLFIKYKLKLPCFVHGFLLKETIREAVFEEKLYNTYSDEQKFRLRGYDNYSIFPLEKLIRSYNLDFELSRYKELLFDFIFLNLDKLGLKGNFIKELEQLQHNYTVDLEVMKYDDFFQLFKPVIYSENGYLDGVLVKSYNDDVLASYTLGDLKGLGKKYDVNVPRRINKSKLIEILTAKFKLTEDESQLLAKKSVLDLEIYAKEKGFKISIDLKKRDMIEFIEFSMGMYHKPVYVDTFNYNIPLATEEEIVVADIEEETVEAEPEVVEPEVVEPVEEEVEVEVVPEPIPEPEPVVEEKPEPVVEEKPEPVVEEKPEPVVEEKPEPVAEPVVESEPKPVTKVPEPVDEALLSNEEKELLDEKINQIIKRYYKKRRRRRTTWIIIIVIILAILAFAAYSYLYYQSNASLPFGIPVFW